MSRKPGTGRRRRVDLKKIEKKEARQVCFSKRRSGLFKKAADLAAIFNIHIAIVVFSPGGKAFTFGLPSVEEVIDLYINQMRSRRPAFMNTSRVPMMRQQESGSGGRNSPNGGNVTTSMTMAAPALNMKMDEPGHDRVRNGYAWKLQDMDRDQLHSPRPAYMNTSRVPMMQQQESGGGARNSPNGGNTTTTIAPNLNMKMDDPGHDRGKSGYARKLQDMDQDQLYRRLEYIKELKERVEKRLKEPELPQPVDDLPTMSTLTCKGPS